VKVDGPGHTHVGIVMDPGHSHQSGILHGLGGGGNPGENTERVKDAPPIMTNKAIKDRHLHREPPRQVRCLRLCRCQ
jgi:hypothetical protein